VGKEHRNEQQHAKYSEGKFDIVLPIKSHPSAYDEKSHKSDCGFVDQRMKPRRGVQ